MKRTYSDEAPTIRRLQGAILYPHDIQEEQTEDGTRYSCFLLRVKDKGQQIDDYKAFALSNYAELRRALYPAFRYQFDMQYHGTWAKEIETIKATFPKPAQQTK